MKKLLVAGIIAVVVSLFASVPARAAKYVGNKACIACHKTEGEEWQNSKHAKAIRRLLPPKGRKATKKKKRLFKKLNKKLKEKLDYKNDYTKDKECPECHTVGMRKEGGFVSMAKTPELAGVGCEMCHGPGGEYSKLHKDKAMTFTRAEAKKMGALYGSESEKVCRQCHDNPDSPMRSNIDEKYKFDWKEFLSLDKTYHKVYPLKGKH